MEQIRGELKNSHAPIMKIRVRDHSGIPLYKAEFRTDDPKALAKHFNFLKDKIGISCFELKEEFKGVEEAKEEITYLNEWREKTKGLREDDEELKRKMREAFSK